MARFVKSIIREGNTLVVTSDDCDQEIIDLCCEDSTTPIEDEDPEEVSPPPGLENGNCMVSTFLFLMVTTRFAEFLETVDPVLAGLPPYALPFVAEWVYSMGWPTTLIAPYTALLGEWTLQGRYTSIRNAVDSLPSADLAPNMRETIYCTMPVNGTFSSAVRKSIADQMIAGVVDPERAVGEFFKLMPIGWLQRYINETMAVIPNPSDYDCSDLDCGGGEGCLDEYLIVWDTHEGGNDGWFALPGSTGDYPLNTPVGEGSKPIVATRSISPPDRWYGANNVPNGVYPAGIQLTFAEPCTINRFTVRAGTGTSNTQVLNLFYKQQGDVSWKWLAEKIKPLNFGETFPIVDYGNPEDGLPAIPNVVAIAVIGYAGGGRMQIRYCAVNYYGMFPTII